MSDRVKPLIAVGCTLLVVCTTTRPLLAEPTKADIAEARQLFADAVALEAEGDYAAATQKLNAALSIKETPGLRYHLAHCQEQAGALVAASANYARATELIDNGAAAPDVAPLLPLAARRIDAHVAKLEILVPAGIDALAELDGQALPRSALGAAVNVDPGQHRLRVSSAGHQDFKADMTFSSGEHRIVKVLFDSTTVPPVVPAVAAPPAPVSVAPSAGAARGGISARGVVLLGEAALTLAGVGLGIGFSVARANASDRVARAQQEVDAVSAGAPNACAVAPEPAACSELDQAIDDHAQATKLATASFVGAGVAAGAFALTWALWPSSTRGLTLAFHPQAAGARLLASGTF